MTDAPPPHLDAALLQVLATRTANGVVVCGADRRIQWVNAGFTRLTGYAADEVQGLHPGALLQGPDADPRTVQAIRAALDAGRGCTIEIRNRRKDGTPFWNHLEIHPIRDAQGAVSCYIALQTDIEPAKQELASLSLHGERLEWALSIGDTAVWEWDLDRSSVWSSQRAKTMLGYRPDELTDSVKAWEDLIHPDDGAAVEEAIQQHLLGRSPLYRSEYRLRNKDGSWRWILDQGRIVDRAADGRPLRVVGTHTDVSARREAASALAASESRLHKVAGQVPGMLYQFMLRPNGAMSFPYASDGILGIYGISPEDAAVSAQPVIDRLHRADLSRVIDSILASGQDLSRWECEYRYVHPDGRTRWLHGHANPERLADGSVLWHGFITDITERRKRESLLTKVAAHVPGMLYQFVMPTDGNGSFPYVSQGISALYGLQPQEAMASWQVLNDRLHPEDRERVMASMRESQRQKTRWDCEYRIVMPDGRSRWVRGESDPEVQEDGSVIWHGYLVDISERKRVEANLRQALQDAEQAARSKSAFLATMSHEIRTPLNGVIGMVELMRLGELTAEQHEHVSTIYSSADNLLQILNDILDFSKLEEGAARAERVAFSPASLVEDALRVVRLKAEEKGLQLRHELAAGLPQRLLGDPSKLRQILFNLLGNAVKFTDQGEVSLRMVMDAGTLVVTVADTGIGMDDEAMARLFQPFSQADSSMSRRYGGSGLGLAISRRLAVVMGGSLDVASRPGEGSVFTCRIPVGIAAAPTPEPAAPAASRQRDFSGRALVVEDNQINQGVARAMLTRMGLTVTIADNGKIALESVAASAFDIIFMDCMMPVMDGLEATRRLRAQGCRLPIVAMTANALPSDRQECMAAGMDEYIAKPITIDRLRKVIAQFLPAQNG